MKILLRLITVLLLAIGGSVAYMVSFENDYIYFPDRQVKQTPNDVGLSFREINFKSEDDITLHGWYMPHAHARFTFRRPDLIKQLIRCQGDKTHIIS